MKYFILLGILVFPISCTKQPSISASKVAAHLDNLYKENTLLASRTKDLNERVKKLENEKTAIKPKK